MERAECFQCKGKDNLLQFNNCNHMNCEPCIIFQISENKTELFASIGNSSKIIITCNLCGKGKLLIEKENLLSQIRNLKGTSTGSKNKRTLIEDELSKLEINNYKNIDHMLGNIDKQFFEIESKLYDERGNINIICDKLIQTVNHIMSISIDKFQKIESDIELVKNIMKESYLYLLNSKQENVETSNNKIEIKDKFLFSNETIQNLKKFEAILDNERLKLFNSELCKNPNDLKYNKITTLEGHTNYISSMIELDNGILASAGDNFIRLWDSKDDFRCIRTLEGHSKHIYCLLKLEDGRIASASKDSTVKLWNPQNDYKCLTLTGHLDAVFSIVLLKNSMLVSRSEDKTFKVWDIQANKCICTSPKYPKPLNNLIGLNDGTILTTNDNNLKIWDYKSTFGTFSLQGHTNIIACVIQLRDEKIVSSSYDFTIRIWDTKKKYICIKIINCKPNSIVTCLLELENGYLVTGSGDNAINIFNHEKDFKCIFNLEEHSDFITQLVELKDGNLASGSGDKTVRIWDTKDNFKCIKELKGHLDGISCILEMKDGVLLTGSADKTIRVYH
jgi:WD40 repeat protein